MGRVLGDSGEIQGRVGDTLVTSIDARVQAVVEQQLAQTIKTARATVDTVTGRTYVADSGAAVVHGGRHRSDRRDGQPADVRPGASGSAASAASSSSGSTPTQAGTPLLSRATQGQFAPGSTWKPFMTAGALQRRLHAEHASSNCSSAFQVGNRDFKNYESGAYGYIGFQKALEVSCNTFFYRIGFDFWQKYGSDVADVERQGPAGRDAKTFGFGSDDRHRHPG